LVLRLEVLMFFSSLSCFKIGYNGWRVGDVALCCACGKAILLKRCYRLIIIYIKLHFLISLIEKQQELQFKIVGYISLFEIS